MQKTLATKPTSTTKRRGEIRVMALIEINSNLVANACENALRQSGKALYIDSNGDELFAVWPEFPCGSIYGRISMIGELASFAMKIMSSVFLSDDEYQLLKDYL